MAALPTPQKTIKKPKYGLSTEKSRFCTKDTNSRPLGSSGMHWGRAEELPCEAQATMNHAAVLEEMPAYQCGVGLASRVKAEGDRDVRRAPVPALIRLLDSVAQGWSSLHSGHAIQQSPDVHRAMHGSCASSRRQWSLEHLRPSSCNHLPRADEASGHRSRVVSMSSNKFRGNSLQHAF